jgi:hypothetical protein
MVLNRIWTSLVLGVLVAGSTGPALAEQQAVKIMMPWDGEGTIHTIGVDQLLFMGEFKGIMYVEKDGGELDTAYATCPASQHIDIKNKQSKAEGYCTITVSSEDVVFAEWVCQGKVGACEGKLSLTGGTGRFAGVTGSSEMIVRSVLNTLVAGMGNGDAIRSATGLAIFPKLTYTLAKAK